MPQTPRTPEPDLDGDGIPDQDLDGDGVPDQDLDGNGIPDQDLDGDGFPDHEGGRRGLWDGGWIPLPSQRQNRPPGVVPQRRASGPRRRPGRGPWRLAATTAADAALHVGEKRDSPERLAGP